MDTTAYLTTVTHENRIAAAEVAAERARIAAERRADERQSTAAATATAAGIADPRTAAARGSAASRLGAILAWMRGGHPDPHRGAGAGPATPAAAGPGARRWAR